MIISVNPYRAKGVSTLYHQLQCNEYLKKVNINDKNSILEIELADSCRLDLKLQ